MKKKFKKNGKKIMSNLIGPLNRFFEKKNKNRSPVPRLNVRTTGRGRGGVRGGGGKKEHWFFECMDEPTFTQPGTFCAASDSNREPADRQGG